MEKLLRFVKRIIYPDGVTEIPISLLLMIFTNIFFYSMMMTMVFSFLPKMVKSFGISEVDTGYYAGIIASSIFFGSLCSSVPWGYISDKNNKRFCTILTGCCSLISTLAFGFSRDWYWAVVTRFLQGFLSAQLVLLKSVLGEVCDDTNMAFGLSVVMTAFSVGNLIGPSVGGFTAFPAEQYPRVFSGENIFGKFVGLLPNAILAIGLGIGVLLTVTFFPKYTNTTNEMTPLLNKNNDLAYGTVEVNETSLDENTNLPSKSGNHSRSTDCVGTNAVRMGKTVVKPGRSLFEVFKSSNVVKVLKTKECWSCCLLYMSFSLVDIGFNETFPVLAATDPKYKGMGFTPTQIGIVMMIVSAALLVLQLTYLPRLNNYLGPQKFLIVTSLLMSFACPMLPVIAAIRNYKLMWIGLIIVIFLYRACVFSGILAINVLINNSVDPDIIGSANGVTMTAANFGRLIAPLISGSIYSWSLGNIKGVNGNKTALGFPFNQFLTFFYLSIVSILIAVFTSTLPKSINDRKTRFENVERNN